MLPTPPIQFHCWHVCLTNVSNNNNNNNNVGFHFLQRKSAYIRATSGKLFFCSSAFLRSCSDITACCTIRLLGMTARSNGHSYNFLLIFSSKSLRILDTEGQKIKNNCFPINLSYSCRTFRNMVTSLQESHRYEHRRPNTDPRRR